MCYAQTQRLSRKPPSGVLCYAQTQRLLGKKASQWCVVLCTDTTPLRKKASQWRVVLCTDTTPLGKESLSVVCCAMHRHNASWERKPLRGVFCCAQTQRLLGKKASQWRVVKGLVPSQWCVVLCTNTTPLGKATQWCVVLYTDTTPRGSSGKASASRAAWLLGWLLCCLTAQQHASVSHGRICSDNCTCCHTETEIADQIFISPSHSILTPGQPVSALTL